MMERLTWAAAAGVLAAGTATAPTYAQVPTLPPVPGTGQGEGLCGRDGAYPRPAEECPVSPKYYDKRLAEAEAQVNEIGGSVPLLPNLIDEATVIYDCDVAVDAACLPTEVQRDPIATVPTVAALQSGDTCAPSLESRSPRYHVNGDVASGIAPKDGIAINAAEQIVFLRPRTASADLQPAELGSTAITMQDPAGTFEVVLHDGQRLLQDGRGVVVEAADGTPALHLRAAAPATPVTVSADPTTGIVRVGTDTEFLSSNPSTELVLTAAGGSPFDLAACASEDSAAPPAMASETATNPRYNCFTTNGKTELFAGRVTHTGLAAQCSGASTTTLFGRLERKSCFLFFCNWPAIETEKESSPGNPTRVGVTLIGPCKKGTHRYRVKRTIVLTTTGKKAKTLGPEVLPIRPEFSC
jgi:hypothetical protein